MRRSILLILGFLWLALGLALIVTAAARPPAIEIVWQTATEFDTAGFNIYRSEHAAGEYTRINGQLIPSAAGATTGASYRYVDDGVSRGRTYYYRLEDVELDNSTAMHEPLAGRAPNALMPAGLLAAASLACGLVLMSLARRPVMAEVAG
jgi:hypothetical protein